MRLGSRAKRQNLLSTAFDAGIRHFDVARMYGLGAAEGELGRFASGKRDQITITTKFGIEAATSSLMSRLQGPGRELISRFPALRKAVKRRDGVFRQPRRYDAETARASLEKSLFELGTDYVDTLFVHDPLDAGDVDLDALGEFLEGARHAGKIRSWGVAGEPAIIGALTPFLPDDAVLQVRDDIFVRHPADLGTVRPRVTFGVLSSALGHVIDHVRSSESVRRKWHEMVGVDCSKPDVVASLLLGDALQANAHGVVLFSTTEPQRIERNLAILESGDPALAAFQRLVSSDLDRSA